MRTCIHEGCDRPTEKMKLCRSHYWKEWSRREGPRKKIAPKGSGIEEKLRFIGWEVDDQTGCWNWLGLIDKHGYGVMARTAVGQFAHRASYHVFVEPVIKGMPIHHKCANRRCMNPSHLELTSQRDNLGEMFLRNFYEKRIAALEAENRELLARLRSSTRARSSTTTSV
ncbi:HNH endonuclease [Nocardia suismassiliense]|uniref:HNH endonuclease n=1 Tax=Nocardia suismassiliense TaxID=2077092 RepID=A0ABW6QNP3_9NOCA